MTLQDHENNKHLSVVPTIRHDFFLALYSDIIFTISLSDRYYNYPNFTNEEIKMQRGKVTCSNSCSKFMGESGFKLDSLGLEAFQRLYKVTTHKALKS